MHLFRTQKLVQGGSNLDKFQCNIVLSPSLVVHTVFVFNSTSTIFFSSSCYGEVMQDYSLFYKYYNTVKSV